MHDAATRLEREPNGLLTRVWVQLVASGSAFGVMVARRI